LHLSPAWKRQLGFEDHELVNSFETHDRLLHPEDRPRIVADRQQINENREEFFEEECRLLHKDGQYRWLLSKGRIIRNARGKATRVVGVDTDITERKQVEQRLAESEERASRAHRLARMAHWSWTPDPNDPDWRGGQILFETAAEMFEVSADSFDIDNAEYLSRFVHPADRNRI